MFVRFRASTDAIVNIDLYRYSAEVMELLIQSSDLFVMQVEMDVYTALKKVHKCNSQKAFLHRHVPTTSLFYVSASAVDVSTAQHSVGRPDQAAPC